MENARAPLLQRVKADEAKGAWYVVPTVLLLYVTFTSLLAFAPAAELVDGWFMQAVALIHKYSRDPGAPPGLLQSAAGTSVLGECLFNRRRAFKIDLFLHAC